MPTVRSNLCIPLDELQKSGDEKMETETIGNNRPNTSFRPVCVKCGVFGAQNGSGYAEFGNTRVLAQVNGPDSDGKWEENYAKITVNLKGIDDQKNAEYRAQLTSAITAIIFTQKYPGKVIDIEVTVLFDDGGVLAASLTAASLAISHSGIENMGLMSSVNVGVKSDGEYITDPSNEETEEFQCSGGVTFSFIPNMNQVTCVDVYGRIPIQSIESLLEFAKLRAIRIVPTLHKAILNSVKEMQ